MVGYFLGFQIKTVIVHFITDLLLIDKFHDMEFALMDVDKQRLKQTHEILLLWSNALRPTRFRL